MDLADYWRGRLSARRLRVLIERLPEQAVTLRVLDERSAWTTGDYLLALVADRLADLAWLYVEAHRAKTARNPKPRPLFRPGERDTQPLITGRELGTWLTR